LTRNWEDTGGGKKIRVGEKCKRSEVGLKESVQNSSLAKIRMGQRTRGSGSGAGKGCTAQKGGWRKEQISLGTLRNRRKEAINWRVKKRNGGKALADIVERILELGNGLPVTRENGVKIGEKITFQRPRKKCSAIAMRITLKTYPATFDWHRLKGDNNEQGLTHRLRRER